MCDQEACADGRAISAHGQDCGQTSPISDATRGYNRSWSHSIYHSGQQRECADISPNMPSRDPTLCDDDIDPDVDRLTSFVYGPDLMYHQSPCRVN